MSCLLFDVVIVQPNNLLEHASTLPVFEQLARFVRAGRLTTTADASAANPHDYLHERVEQTLARSSRATGRDRAARRRALEELRRRYAAILPRRWIVRRNVRAQVGVFLDRMRAYLEEAPHGGWLERRMSGWIDAGLDAGVRADRDFVLSHLARLRDTVSPREVARLATFAQATYLDGGTLGHEPDPGAPERTCVLYPGRFAARLPTADARFSSLAAPPFAASARPEEVRHRLGAIGLSLDVILALPPAELLDVASSAAWTRVRSEEVVAEELRARFAEARDFRDALPVAAALLPGGQPSSAPLLPVP